MAQPGQPQPAFIGLGSNLGNREQNLIAARELIGASVGRIARTSSIYETEPAGYVSQPWFLNQVVELVAEPADGPDALLERLLAIERDLGRERLFKGGPRSIDLDLLLYGDAVEGWDVPKQRAVERGSSLIVPHPRLHQRRFVLVPLNEIAPQFVHPVLRVPIKELLDSCDDRPQVHPFPMRELNDRSAY